MPFVICGAGGCRVCLLLLWSTDSLNRGKHGKVHDCASLAFPLAWGVALCRVSCIHCLHCPHSQVARLHLRADATDETCSH